MPILRFALAAAIVAPSPALAAKAVSLSWGKEGVGFERYRQDAVECGRSGYYLDVSGTEAAKVFRAASTRLELNELSRGSGTFDAGMLISSARIVEGTRPIDRMEDVRSLLQGTVDGCLIERGYTPFRLNDAQKRQLQRLHLGSQERHAFLYRLATDPNVLRRQAVAFTLAEVDASAPR